MCNLKGVILYLTVVILFSSYVYCNINKVRSNKKARLVFHSNDTNRKRFKAIHLNSNRDKINDDDEVKLKPENSQNYTAENNDTEANRIVRKEKIGAETTLHPHERREKGLPPAIPKAVLEKERFKRKCWINVNAKKHFDVMDELDDRFASVRNKYQEILKSENFDQKMMTMMLKTKGTAIRAVHEAAGDPGFIPAGINLGGFSMMELDDSIMFFHRMKLRNNTHFRVDSLDNDLSNMILRTNLSLNDLHILGAYERTTTGREPFEVFYTPTFGEVELLLRNVQYNMEGRYRLLRNKLTIELIISNITPNDILMTYQSNAKNKKTLTLQRKTIDEILDRLKINLDKWLKDYFNDYLIYFDFEGNKTINDLSKYDKEKTIALNEFADEVLEKIQDKLHQLKFNAVQIPNFAVTAVNGMQLKLSNGVLRGLDTIYRRSFATGKKEVTLRKIDTVVGFSSLKATYQYEAVFNTGIPPINGILIVTADELIAHMGQILTETPETFNLQFDSIQQIKPESLILEGPANRVMGNFRNLLERLVFTFISNAIINNVRMLNSITECDPNLKAFNTEEKDFSQENDSKPNEKEIELNSNTEDPNTTTAKLLINQNPNDIENGNDNTTTKTELSLNKNYDKSSENLSQNEEDYKTLLKKNSHIKLKFISKVNKKNADLRYTSSVNLSTESEEQRNF